MRRKAPGIKNIGPVSSRWLASVGLRKRADLIRLGAVGAFLKVKEAGYKPTLNLLWALAGAERGLHWTRLPQEARQRLLLELDAAESAKTRAAGGSAGPASGAKPAGRQGRRRPDRPG